MLKMGPRYQRSSQFEDDFPQIIAINIIPESKFKNMKDCIVKK